MQTHSFVDCYLFIKPKDNKWILKQENLIVTLKENAVLKGNFLPHFQKYRSHSTD